MENRSCWLTSGGDNVSSCRSKVTLRHMTAGTEVDSEVEVICSGEECGSSDVHLSENSNTTQPRRLRPGLRSVLHQNPHLRLIGSVWSTKALIYSPEELRTPLQLHSGRKGKLFIMRCAFHRPQLPVRGRLWDFTSMTGGKTALALFVTNFSQ